MTARTVAALYVDVERGPYPKLVGVDCWDSNRDATGYRGPHPVVAHPPCGYWGRYRHRCHDDGSTGFWAVDAVRTWGGVLEQPADSRLFDVLNMPAPGWLPDAWGGYTLHVAQADYCHPALKPTWLYVVGVPPSVAVAHLAEWKQRRSPTLVPVERMAKSKRHLTPPALAVALVAIARSADVTVRR
jgi:hypothetical protein